MYKQRYDKVKTWILAKKRRQVLFAFIYKYLPYSVFAGYALLLAYLFFTKDGRLFICIAVPLFMFATLSAVRNFLDLERPYEKYDITPIYKKDTKGHSFPSRHTASAAVIGATFLYVSMPLGAVFLTIALLIALSRIAAGVHFPRDAAAGFLYALLCGLVYLFF